VIARARHRKPHLLTSIGLAVLGTGVIAWAWTGRWEWAVTGLGLYIILAGVGTYLDGRPS
jgi:hypothetical protein